MALCMHTALASLGSENPRVDEKAKWHANGIHKWNPQMERPWNVSFLAMAARDPLNGNALTSGLKLTDIHLSTEVSQAVYVTRDEHYTGYCI